MPQIEIYQAHFPPIDYKDVSIKLTERDFSEYLKREDKKRIESRWEKALEENKGIFSIPRGLANLSDTQNNTLTFDSCDFKTYLAVSRTWGGSNPLSTEAYDAMRIAAIGAVAYLGDGGIFIHKRSKKATHVPNAWDSSVAGLAHIQNGNEINFLPCLYEKLQRELGFTLEEIEESEIKLTGIHSSREYDFSGGMSFIVNTSLNSRTIEERVRGNKNFEGYAIIPQEKLGEFILTHHLEDENPCLDGVATLLQTFPQDEFMDLVDKINKLRPLVRFGRLKRGRFLEKPL